MANRGSSWRRMPDSNPFAHFIRLGQSVKKASQLPCCFVEPMSSSAPAVSVALWIVKDSLQLGCFQLRLSMKLEGDHKRLLHSTGKLILSSNHSGQLQFNACQPC
ncbi:TPA: hypothetical protein ACH3X1_004370 [Trebouxia sp. C0004]